MSTIFVKRGLQSELTGGVLGSGELGYTTDFHNLYAGDGSVNYFIGRTIAGTYASMPASASANTGKLYFATDTERLYRDNGTTWDLILSNDLDDLTDGTYAKVLASEVSSGQVTRLDDGTYDVSAQDLSNHVGTVGSAAAELGKHRLINDSGTSTTELWSADKIAEHIDSKIQGLTWREAVIDILDFSDSEPAAPTLGDRYINTYTGSSNVTAQTVAAMDILEWNSSDWTEITPTEGWATYVLDLNVQYNFNDAGAWVSFGSTTTHNATSGKQGGTAEEYYHLTAAQHGAIGSGFTSWTLKGDGATTYPITDGDTANFVGGTGISADVTGDDILTITNDSPNIQSDLAAGTRTTTSFPITNTDGSGVTVPAATTSLAGLMTDAQFDKLAGIEDGADVNVNTNLSLGTRTATTMLVNSSTGNNVNLLAATTTQAGLMTDAQFDYLASLTDNSVVDTLHRHSELVASDGNPDPALTINATGDTLITRSGSVGGPIDLNHALIVHDSIISPVVVGASGDNENHAIQVNNKLLYIDTGLTDTGVRTGINIDSSVSDTWSRGTLTDQFGLNIKTGIEAGSGSGTITNSYGIHLNYVEGAGTVTNKWGIFQDGSTVNNHFDGNLSIGGGNDTPTAALDVDGSAAVTGDVAALTFTENGTLISSTYLAIADIDDTPVNGVTDAPISSNWAYDHANDGNPHGVTENVSTTLDHGTITATTYGIDSDGSNNDIILPEATTSTAGLLGADKWDEIVANSLKNTNVSSDLAVGTRTATTLPITNTDGNGVTLPAATTSLAGLMTDVQFDKLAGITPGADTSSGLESLTETTTGWRLIGRTAANFGNIGDGAVDFSRSVSTSTTRGATGQFSFAANAENTALAISSTVFGFENSTTADATESFVCGWENTANSVASFVTGRSSSTNGLYAMAAGFNCEANGDYSAALGQGAEVVLANDFGCVALGKYNSGLTSTVLEVGIGASDGARVNAFEVYQDGTVKLPDAVDSAGYGLIDTLGDGAVVTLGWVGQATIDGGTFV